MAKFFQKWKRAISGSKNNKESLIENDFLQHATAPTNDEFTFSSGTKKTGSTSIIGNTSNSNNTLADRIFPIYNEYDNLKHNKKTSSAKQIVNGKPLKDSTNSNKSGPVRVLKRVFTSQKSLPAMEKKSKAGEINENFDYCELYAEQNEHNEFLNKKMKLSTDDTTLCVKKNNIVTLDANNNIVEKPIFKLDNFYYNEVSDGDKNNLIKNIQQYEYVISPQSNLSDSKMNLFTRFDYDTDNQQSNKISKKSQNITEQIQPESFPSRLEAFNWYLNRIYQMITDRIQHDNTLVDTDRAKRLNICNAHLLFAKNFYEMRINNMAQLKLQLANIHPCMIALACLLESDAVRIVEQHSCSCDTYIYLFETRLKFCAWKTKLYILLKKPSRSSIERLNLIEGLTNCHKLISPAKQ